jgi:uncharacterized protein (TIGR02453 family)
MEAFAEEMIRRMAQLDPAITMTPKQSVFRIHRDTRFSKNGKPYKENAAMVVAPGGRHEPGVAGLYFTFDAGNVNLASGCYFLEPDQLAKIRRHIVANNAEFRRLLAEPAFVEKWGEIQGVQNKILPPEFKEAGKGEPLLFNKQFFYYVQHPVETIEREDLADFVMAHMNACQDLNRFLTAPLK